MKKENLLLVCFDVKDLKKINKIDLSKYAKVVVASDDFRVHEECEKLDFVDDVTFLQRAIPFTKVANDVIATVEKINHIQKCYAQKLNFQEELFLWRIHAEGGEKTQIIQDILLYINIFTTLITEYSIGKVYLLDMPFDILKSKILILICKKFDIQCIKISNGYKLNFNEIIKKVKKVIKPVYKICKTLLIKIQSISLQNLNTLDKVVLVQLFSLDLKHVFITLDLIKPLKQRSFTPIVISWGVDCKVDCHFKSFHNLHIENFLNFRDILNAFNNLFKLYINILFLQKLTIKNITYNGIDLSDLITPYIKQSIFEDIPSKQNLAIAFSKFIAKQPDVVACRLVTYPFFDEAVIMESLMSNEHILYFHFNLGASLPNPYLKYNAKKYHSHFNRNFLFFSTGEIDKSIFLKDVNIDSNKIIITGMRNNLKSIIKEKKEYLKKDICYNLNIEEKYDYYILYDYPSIILGYQSIDETFESLFVVLNFIQDKNNICLIIKPHPSAKTDLLSLIIQKYQKIKNIYICKKEISIFDILPLSDILITKFSTIGFEAMNFDTIVISCLFEKNDSFKIYGNAAKYVFSQKELLDTLKILLDTQQSFNQHKVEYSALSKIFLKQLYKQNPDDALDVMSSEISKYMLNKKGKIE